MLPVGAAASGGASGTGSRLAMGGGTGPTPQADPAVLRRLQAAAEADIAAHTEIAQAVAGLPRAQMQLCLGTVQRLATEAPDATRAMLQEHPQLCYALLQAQLHLGLSLDPTMPPNDEEKQQLMAKAAARPGMGAMYAGVPRVMPVPVAPVRYVPMGQPAPPPPAGAPRPGAPTPASVGLLAKARAPVAPGLQ
eukprot:TRINITY_DN49790_c0_g1_i1.p1 TRINITY_DN49790_c0_g1~~TRINITY_DN49790_c0_g1_i1.p1  ORF type:complete len:193 (-),score=39.53 TRINITY_DN49790_c0_g1_i1:34-612(-)